MTRLRALAEDLDLESTSGGRVRPPRGLLRPGACECMEALIGAIYLDGGMSAAAGVLRRLGLTEDA